MIFDLVPILIILISLVVVAFIVIKKFPQVANVDVDNIPEEKQAELKNKILEKQIEKRLEVFKLKLAKIFSPVTKFFVAKLGSVRQKLNKKKDELKYKHDTIKESELNPEEKLHQLLDEGASLMETGKNMEAEEVFIKALEIDKTVDIIYHNLADIYVARKKYDYAIETFEYLISLENKKISKAEELNEKEEARLLKQDLAQIYFDLANTYKKIEDYKLAKKYIEKALLIDFRNPRYLDFLCEISIMLGDKIGAESCISRLREANADNNKIEKWEQEIEKLD